MSELVLQRFEVFRESVRISDVVDILLVALVLYFLMILLKQMASRRVFTGVMVMACLYFAAGAFHLYMTSLLFNAVFAVLMVAFIVVFQDDIRRGFDRVAALGWRTAASHPLTADTEIDTLAEATFTLASDHRGALIVVKGQEGLDRHVDGGFELNGHLSKPLLYSIFDPNSAGHDGAVIVEDNTVTRFAVHLPLSRSGAKARNLGTRHSAALGLSERCDALIIAVSEERGTVSVAEDGQLDRCGAVADLTRRLENFVRESTAPPIGPAWKTALTRDFREKLVALLLATLAWYAFAFKVETVYQTFVVPIEYRNVPKDFKLDDSYPTQAQLTLSGPERDLLLVAPRELKVAIDMSVAARGVEKFTITEKELHIPPNLDIYRVEPSVIWIKPQR